MNSRFLSISLSVAAAIAMASADVLAQGRGGGGGGAMGGGTGQGGMQGGGTGGTQGGGMPSATQRGAESAPVERPAGAQDRGRSPSVEQRQVPAAAEQAQGKTAQEQLTLNPRLADNVSKLLPAGTDVQAAAAGFNNLGEFVSAVHVSNNLGIPFADLKTRVLAGDSLGTAIQALKPGVDAQLEVSKARARADELAKG